MKTHAEVRAFFEGELSGDLRKLEEARLKHKKKFRTLRLVILGLVLLGHLALGLILVQSGLFLTEPYAIFGILFLFEIGYLSIIFVVWIVGHTRIIAAYQAPEFKVRIIERLLKFIAPSLEYRPGECVPKKDYDASRIFAYRRTAIYKGDDLVTGRLGKTGFAFSEILAKYKNPGKDGSSSFAYSTLFHGLFFYADFNKSLKGKTFVLPDRREKKYGRLIAQYLQAREKFYGELVKLEDPLFEKYFVVYGSDQVEARYILTPGLMKRIREYREKTGKEIMIAFVNERIYVAVNYDRDVFEASLFRSFLDFDLIRQYYEDLDYAVGLVEDLNLNTRIWN